MAEHRVEEGAHVVLVTDKDCRILATHWSVPDAELPILVARLQQAHAHATITVDGQPLGGLMPASPPGSLEESLERPESVASHDDMSPLSSVRLAHTMLWATFDRAARVQSWMLQQANVFTRDLLDNNRKLADQASDMQQRYQQAMQRLDLMETEKTLMEHDLMARRLSRHTVAQNRAEEEASRPAPPPDYGWVEELLAGVSALIGGGMRPPKNWPKN